MSDIVPLLAFLFSVITLAVVVVFILIGRRTGNQIDPAVIKNAVADSLQANQENFKNMVKLSISESDSIKDKIKATITDMGIDSEIGALNKSASNILEEQRRINEVFSIKSKRGAFGEMRLEDIMKDYFDSGWVHIREKISSKVEIPDMHIDTPQGKLCVDSKFPLENYQKMISAPDDASRKKAEREFENDMEKHVHKVSQYVKPEEGTARVALMYVPSEAIYAYIAYEKPLLMRQAASESVLIVSPSTIIPQMAVIRSYIEAEKIIRNVDEIKRKIEGYQRGFEVLLEEWAVLEGHVDNASRKSNAINSGLQGLNSELSGLFRNLKGDTSEKNGK